MAQDRLPSSTTTASPKRGMPYWRWLLAPMLLASLGLHGLILFVPTAPSEDELLPPPDPEEDGVAITKIDAPQSRTPTTAPADSGTAQTTAAQPRTATGAPGRSPRNATATNQGTPPGASDRTPTNRTPTNRAPANSTASGTSSDSQGTDVPNFAQMPSVDDPNPDSPPVDGRATSGSGRTPPDRANAAAASGPDPFEKYIEAFETYNGVNLSAADAADIQANWLESFRDRGPDFSNLDIEPLKIFDPLPYESNICLPHVPAAAQLLVLVEADGTVDTYQPFIQRTGYRLFDNAAADAVRQHDFPTADTPQAYLTEVAVDYDTADCEWPPPVDKLPAAYFTVLDNYIGPDLTTPAEAKAAQDNWLQSLRENADLALPQTDELTAEVFADFEPEVPYPLEICLPLEPKDAEFGVVVQPDGSLSAAPVLLRSTGYRNFDDRAQALVAEFAFPAADTTRLWVVEVPVDYNDVNCQPLDSDSFEVPTTTATGATPSSGESPTESNDPAPSEATVPPATGTAIAFDPDQQTPLLATGRQRVEADAVGSLNTQLAIAAASLELGWPDAVDQSCFLADLTTERFEPVEAAADAIILSESADFVPSTLSRLYQATAADAGEYCGAPLIQLSVEGTPQLLASTIPFGSGGANALVVLWTADPRAD